jgi:hypothetical protein
MTTITLDTGTLIVNNAIQLLDSNGALLDLILGHAAEHYADCDDLLRHYALALAREIVTEEPSDIKQIVSVIGCIAVELLKQVRNPPPAIRDTLTGIVSVTPPPSAEPTAAAAE